MNARSALRLLVRRGGTAPSWLASRDRLDLVEIVEIGSGEVVLAWELEPRKAARLARALRRDLELLEPGEFITAWRNAD